MSSPEQIEMQTLTSEIAAVRSRLAAARMSKNEALVQTLAAEIAAAEAGLASMGEAIGTSNRVTTDEPEGAPEETGITVAPGALHTVDGAHNQIDKAEPSVGTEGVGVMPDRLIAIDAIENANRVLSARRAETLARHADELDALDKDQLEIDAMASAMNAFIQKFGSMPSEISVVRLDEQRDLRLQRNS